MSKAKLVIVGLGCAVAAIGLGGMSFVASSDECSHSPEGKFRLSLAGQGIEHYFNPERECDVWKVVEPDPQVTSITIIPYSSWTDAPSRQVRIDADGVMAVLEPTDQSGEAVREVARTTDRAITGPLLAELSRFVRYNRLTTVDIDQLVKERPEILDDFNVQDIVVEPIIHCTGTMYDGGGVNLRFTLTGRNEREAIFDTYCHSIAKEDAIESLWKAHTLVFEITGFEGEAYVDDLGTF